MTPAWREEAPDILSVPFMGSRTCARLCELSEQRKDEFKPYGPDVDNNAAPGQEMRLNLLEPSMLDEFRGLVDTIIHPIIRMYWWPLKTGPIRMPFVIRYDPARQAHLDPHHDAAQVSLAIPLNTGFEGGELQFPRQQWSARDVPVGHAIIFPSRVTHVHLVTPVTSGIRYSMTCWLNPRNHQPEDPL